MPTDASAGENGDSEHVEIPAAEVDDLTFASHDLGRDRAPSATAEHDDADFSMTPRPVVAPPPQNTDSFVVTERVAAPGWLAGSRPAMPHTPAPTQGFVIREPGAAPTAPVDALVVGAPRVAEPTPANPAPAGSFRISTTSMPASDPSAPPPWMVRAPAPSLDPASPAATRGWGTRAGKATAGSAHAAMIRLREEAVQVSWKAAWIAVTAADPRLARKRNP